MVKQADVLAQSRIIPRAYQGKHYDIIAAGLAGQSFGWDIMTSMRNYHVIEGSASLRPEAMLGLVRQRGHSVSVSTFDGVRDNQPCRIAKAVGMRNDNGDEHVAEFTTLDAKRAGLAGKTNWKNYEDAMLTWRCVSALCRVLFPDVVLGAGYVPEELGAIVNETGEMVEDDPFAVPMLSAIAAKTELLECCEGNKTLAKELWGERGSNPVAREELDAMMREALLSLETVAIETNTEYVEQIFDAEVVQDIDLGAHESVVAMRAALDTMKTKRATLGSKSQTTTTQQEIEQ
jgi:hypothetical protein